jgi:hypothetical protein
LEEDGEADIEFIRRETVGDVSSSGVHRDG